MDLSVIIVSYNEGEYIAECFESILRQKMNFEYEVIVGDDGSSDNTLGIIKTYEKKFKNFSYFVQDRALDLKRSEIIPSIRASNVMYRAMKQAKGRYINIISADDYFIDEHYFQNALSFLSKHKHYSAYVTTFYTVHPDGSREYHKLKSRARFSFWHQQYIHLSCFVFKNLCDNNVLLNNLCDDCGLQYSIALNGKLKYTEDKTFAYCQREDSIMHSHDREALDILEMLLFQDVLNKTLPSITKLYAYFMLYAYTFRHFSGPFLALYKKRGSIESERYKKYAEVSTLARNDIIGALLNPEQKKSRKLLKKIRFRIRIFSYSYRKLLPHNIVKAVLKKIIKKLGQIATENLQKDFHAKIQEIRLEQNEMHRNILEIATRINSVLEKKIMISEVQNHYRNVRTEVLARVAQGKKLRFASYIVYGSTFGAHEIVRLMLEEPDKYEVRFVICPDTYRDKDFSQYHKTKDFFIERYGAEYVLDGYDENTGEFLDYSQDFDVIYLANPYDCLVNKVHGISYLCSKDVLPIHIDYGLQSFIYNYSTPEWKVDSCLYYKYFANTIFEKTSLQDCRIAICDNIIVSGYVKMDVLYSIKEIPHKRKKILICFHQGVKNGDEDILRLNFLEYADFLLTLPDLYPDIDFVFRPHPLLFVKLRNFDIWEQRRIDEYIKNCEKKNIVCSQESDYLHLFKECDAIVHDCGSFIEEWLYTGKPCCYIVDSDNGFEKLKKLLSAEGKIAIRCYTIADSAQKIIDFIDSIRNAPPHLEKIDKDVQEKIMVNYPNASKYVLDNLLV